MCLLCDQARGQQFQASQRADGRALYGLSIAPAELLDAGNVAATRQTTATDGVLDAYSHTPWRCSARFRGRIRRADHPIGVDISGDASEAVLNNQFWSYRFGTVTPALA